MSESKHTPAPWGWETMSETDTRRIALSGDKDDVMIATQGADGCCFADISDADARLIAAAPELLSACLAWVEFFDEMTRYEDPMDPLPQTRKRIHGGRIEAFREAIARATGTDEGKP